MKAGLFERGIVHSTVECEAVDEACGDAHCELPDPDQEHFYHRHHHGH